MRIVLNFANEVSDKKAKFLLVENELSSNEIVAKEQLDRLGESLKAEGCKILSVLKEKDVCTVNICKGAPINVLL